MPVRLSLQPGGCGDQLIEPLDLVGGELVYHMANDRPLVAEDEHPPGHLLLFIEDTILPADPPVPVSGQRKGELCQSLVKDLERRQVIDRDSHHLNPQSLEVLVPLAQQHKLLGSDGGEGLTVKAKQERPSPESSQRDLAGCGGELKGTSRASWSKRHVNRLPAQYAQLGMGR